MDKSEELIQYKTQILMIKENDYMIFQQTRPDQAPRGPVLDEAPQNPLDAAQRAAQPDSAGGPTPVPTGEPAPPANGAPGGEDGPVAMALCSHTVFST